MSGGKGKQTVGYWYYMGLHGGLCHGPVDEFNEVRGGDITLWTGSQTVSGAITINAEKAYGGEDHEGGVKGTLDVMMGEPTQGANSYLTSIVGGVQSAFRGLLTFVLRGAKVGANNPYPKPFSFRVFRAKKGWANDAAWFPETAVIYLGGITGAPASWSLDGYSVTPIGAFVDVAPPVASLNQFTAELADYYDQTYTYPSTPKMFAFWRPNESGLMYSKRLEGSVTNPPVVAALIARGWQPNQTALVQYYVVGDLQMTVMTVGAASSPPPAPAGYSWAEQSESPMSTPFGTVRLWAAPSLNFTLDTSRKAMNPAHIVYECLTNTDWGMGYPTSIIDDAAFRVAAQKLYGERFGLCLLWKRDDSIENFIQHIMDTVGAVLVQSKTTGLFQFNLIRGGYNIATLPVFTADDVQIVSVDSSVLTGATNEITVNWFDPSQKIKRSTTVQSLGNIQSQGVVVSATRDYPGIPTESLAARVAARDLRAATVPLKRVELRVNRSAYDLLPGGLFVLNFPDYEIETMVFRVGEVDYGTLEQGYITVTAVQDMFSLPDTTYIGAPTTGWTPPSTAPTAAPYSAPFEVDYRSLYRQMTASDLAALPADAGYAGMMNARPSGTAINYEIWSRVSPASYAQHGEADFCPTATLAAGIGRLDTSITLLAGIDLDNVAVPCAALIDGEIVAVTALNTTTGVATIGRGCVDTVPATHSTGARVWFFDDHVGSDAVQYTTGETVDQKALTKTSTGVLDISGATAVSVAINNRQSRPYPPGNVKIGGVAYPTTVSGNFTVTWAHRNRFTQMDQLVDTTAASVTPADNTRYGLRFLDASAALIVERTDIGPGTATVSLNYTGNVTMELFTIDNVGQSTQKHSFTFAFTGTGTNTITATAYTPVDDTTIIDGGTV